MIQLLVYLLTFISSIPAVFLQGPVLNDPNFIIGGAGLSLLALAGAATTIATQSSFAQSPAATPSSSSPSTTPPTATSPTTAPS